MSDKKVSGKKTVVALGYFDGAHKGHTAVLSAAKAEADRLHAIPAVFTFDGNLKGKLSDGKCLFTVSERADIYKKSGFTEIFFAPVSDGFLSLSPADFLDLINGKYDIAAYVCGEDYRFGKGGAGDVGFLKNYAERRGQSVFVCPSVLIGKEKVSTTRIKEFLKNGEIRKANGFLGFDYFIKGEVNGGRKVGRLLGFPTVNIKVDEDKTELKNGVYAGYSEIGGVKYKAVINYGSRPTYGLGEKLIEAHLIGFNGSLYGKTVSVCFTGYLRDIKKFDGEEELKNQLKKDVINALKGDNE